MLKNSLFKLNTNKKFNYKPRYLKEKKEPSILTFESRIKFSRQDLISNDRSSFWKQERLRKRIKENNSFNKVFIIILFFLLLIFFFIIDFDFSIFIKY